MKEGGEPKPSGFGDYENCRACRGKSMRKLFIKANYIYLYEEETK